MANTYINFKHCINLGKANFNVSIIPCKYNKYCKRLKIEPTCHSVT